LSPDETAAAFATIARPEIVVATSLRDAVGNLQSDPSPHGEHGGAVQAIRATGIR
jgi:hypothetical protein